MKDSDTLKEILNRIAIEEDKIGRMKKILLNSLKMDILIQESNNKSDKKSDKSKKAILLNINDTKENPSKIEETKLDKKNPDDTKDS